MVIFVDFNFEDMEVMYPKIRLEEEGATVLCVGAHDAGMKYTGKYGYPIKSNLKVDELDPATIDALVLPGGFAPDYMRRNAKMLSIIVHCCTTGVPVAAICHGPWMLCSARYADGTPVAAGKRATAFVAIKDDLINAGAEFVDEPVVVDTSSTQYGLSTLITSRTPNDLTPFCQAIIAATAGAAPPCCPSGSWPALVAADEYTPVGTEAVLEEGPDEPLPIYTVGKPGAKAVIVLPEVFGWSGRLKGICDTLANEGYLVVMPDCHRGDTAAGKADFAAWARETPWAKVNKDLLAVMAFLEAKGATSVGAIGFCWGVWALAKASSEGFDLKCGVGPHPSTKLEGMVFGGDEKAMLEAAKMPILLMPASNDAAALKPGGELCTVVEANGGESVSYDDMTHGWASRGDLSKPEVARDAKDCYKRSIAFFKKHL